MLNYSIFEDISKIDNCKNFSYSNNHCLKLDVNDLVDMNYIRNNFRQSHSRSIHEHPIRDKNVVKSPNNTKFDCLITQKIENINKLSSDNQNNTDIRKIIDNTEDNLNQKSINHEVLITNNTDQDIIDNIIFLSEQNKLESNERELSSHERIFANKTISLLNNEIFKKSANMVERNLFSNHHKIKYSSNTYNPKFISSKSSGIYKNEKYSASNKKVDDSYACNNKLKSEPLNIKNQDINKSNNFNILTEYNTHKPLLNGAINGNNKNVDSKNVQVSESKLEKLKQNRHSHTLQSGIFNDIISKINIFDNHEDKILTNKFKKSIDDKNKKNNLKKTKNLILEDIEAFENNFLIRNNNSKKNEVKNNITNQSFFYNKINISNSKITSRLKNSNSSFGNVQKKYINKGFKRFIKNKITDNNINSLTFSKDLNISSIDSSNIYTNRSIKIDEENLLNKLNSIEESNSKKTIDINKSGFSNIEQSEKCCNPFKDINNSDIKKLNSSKNHQENKNRINLPNENVITLKTKNKDLGIIKEIENRNESLIINSKNKTIFENSLCSYFQEKKGYSYNLKNKSNTTNESDLKNRNYEDNHSKYENSKLVKVKKTNKEHNNKDKATENKFSQKLQLLKKEINNRLEEINLMSSEFERHKIQTKEDKNLLNKIEKKTHRESKLSHNKTLILNTPSKINEKSHRNDKNGSLLTQSNLFDNNIKLLEEKFKNFKSKIQVKNKNSLSQEQFQKFFEKANLLKNHQINELENKIYLNNTHNISSRCPSQNHIIINNKLLKNKVEKNDLSKDSNVLNNQRNQENGDNIYKKLNNATPMKSLIQYKLDTTIESVKHHMIKNEGTYVKSECETIQNNPMLKTEILDKYLASRNNIKERLDIQHFKSNEFYDNNNNDIEFADTNELNPKIDKSYIKLKEKNILNDQEKNYMDDLSLDLKEKSSKLRKAMRNFSKVLEREINESNANKISNIEGEKDQDDMFGLKEIKNNMYETKALRWSKISPNDRPSNKFVSRNDNVKLFRNNIGGIKNSLRILDQRDEIKINLLDSLTLSDLGKSFTYMKRPSNDSTITQNKLNAHNDHKIKSNKISSRNNFSYNIGEAEKINETKDNEKFKISEKMKDKLKHENNNINKLTFLNIKELNKIKTRFNTKILFKKIKKLKETDLSINSISVDSSIRNIQKKFNGKSDNINISMLEKNQSLEFTSRNNLNKLIDDAIKKKNLGSNLSNLNKIDNKKRYLEKDGSKSDKNLNINNGTKTTDLEFQNVFQTNLNDINSKSANSKFNMADLIFAESNQANNPIYNLKNLNEPTEENIITFSATRELNTQCNEVKNLKKLSSLEIETSQGKCLYSNQDFNGNESENNNLPNNNEKDQKIKIKKKDNQMNLLYNQDKKVISDSFKKIDLSNLRNTRLIINKTKTSNSDLKSNNLHSQKNKNSSSSNNFKFLNELLHQTNKSQKNESSWQTDKNTKDLFSPEKILDSKFSSIKNYISQYKKEKNSKNNSCLDYVNNPSTNLSNNKTVNNFNHMNPAISKINKMKSELSNYIQNQTYNNTSNTNQKISALSSSYINLYNILNTNICNVNTHLSSSNFNFNFNFYNTSTNHQVTNYNHSSNINYFGNDNGDNSNNNVNFLMKLLENKSEMDMNKINNVQKINAQNNLKTNNKNKFIHLDKLTLADDKMMGKFNFTNKNNKNSFSTFNINNVLEYPTTAKNKGTSKFNFDEANKKNK